MEVLLINETHPLPLPLRVTYTDTFWGRLRGLMFRSALGTQEGLLMVQPSQDRLNAAIHMLFMNFDIAVIWLDKNLQVVDGQIALRWRPAYTPAKPAKYVLEIHPSRLSEFMRNDKILIQPCKD